METLASGIRYRHWHVDNARGAVLLVHGLGEHSGRYQHLAEMFNARGLAVLAPDHLGHGESPGHRVFVQHFDDYLLGARELRAVIAQQYPQVPCFILGHSMGGLITGRLLLEDQDQYQGALLSGPAFAAEAPPRRWSCGLDGCLQSGLPRRALFPSTLRVSAEIPRWWLITSQTPLSIMAR